MTTAPTARRRLLRVHTFGVSKTAGGTVFHFRDASPTGVTHLTYTRRTS